MRKTGVEETGGEGKFGGRYNAVVEWDRDLKISSYYSVRNEGIGGNAIWT